jgi:hypothetical protein
VCQWKNGRVDDVCAGGDEIGKVIRVVNSLLDFVKVPDEMYVIPMETITCPRNPSDAPLAKKSVAARFRLLASVCGTGLH